MKLGLKAFIAISVAAFLGVDKWFNLFQSYLDNLISHMALDGKIPSEACGIKIEGVNKWLTIIQNARKKEKMA